MKMPGTYLVLLILVGCAVSLRGQEVEKADRLYETEGWEAASHAYRQIVAAQPTNARAWFRLGVCLHHLGRYEDAVEAFGEAEENGTPMRWVGYQLARTHAVRGDEEAAFEWLDRALDAGFSEPERMESDEALADLREDTRFEQAARRADINARPCEVLPKYNEFDFWIGKWEVTAGGQTAGTNTIQEILKGCALLENWTSAGGDTGKSFNYYDPSKKKWVQLWIDSEGGVIQAEGELANGSMSFTGKHVYRNGREEHLRMTFTPVGDGSVRQLIEQSKDGGETWYVWFDGAYRRRD